MVVTAGTRLGPYEIISLLGAGGMGEVYRARDTRLKRDVAVKVLPEALSQHPDALARFEREALAVAALSHPNILSLFDVGEEGGVRFAVTELLEGETLRAFAIRGRVPLRRTLEIVHQLADALAAAHERGIVHRDVKPDNVFVTKDGRAKVLDFGLARGTLALRDPEDSCSPTASALTEAGVVVGTVAYMSPEQASGHPVDHRSDQFSLGVVLYELLAGKRPFVRETAAETLTAIIREEPEPLEKVVPNVPAPVRWMVERLLAKEASGRYTATRDLAQELASLRTHLSEVTTAPTSAASTGAGAVARPGMLRFAGIALSLLLAVAVGAGLGVSTLGDRTRPLPNFLKLTFGRGAIDGARFVPGSRDVVYSARWQGSPSTLYLLRDGSTESRALEPAGAILLAASSRGEAAVQTSPVLYQGRLEGTLSILPLAGGGMREISRRATDLDFSADGSTFCLVTRTDGSAYRLEWPQGEVLATAEGVLGCPRLHGRRAAFIRCRLEWGNNCEILVVARGEKPRPLASAAGITSLAWAPGGDEIWYSTYDGGESLIQAVSLSGNARVLARHAGRLELVDVGPEGRCLAVVSSHLRQAFGRAPGSKQDVDLTWLDAQGPQGLTSDGRQVLLAHHGDWNLTDHATLFLRSLEGGPAVKLGSGSGGAGLSADGRWAATFEADAKGEVGIRLFPTAAGASRWFSLRGQAVNGNALWFHLGGGRIYFDDPRKKSVGRLDLTTREVTADFIPRSVTYFNGMKPFAPDGRRLLFVDASFVPPEGGAMRNSFLLFDEQAKSPRSVQGVLDSEAVAGWDEASRELYVYDRNAIPAEVVRWNPDTGIRRPFLRIAPPDPSGVWGIQRLMLTPSGSAYAYTVARRFSDLYLIEGLK